MDQESTSLLAISGYEKSLIRCYQGVDVCCEILKSWFPETNIEVEPLYHLYMAGVANTALLREWFLEWREWWDNSLI